MVAHGLTAGLLFLLIGLLYERTHSRDLAAYGSLNRIAPRFAVFLVFTLLASVGLPGSAGFIAELQVLIGAYGRWGGWLVLLSVAVLISAAYALRAIRCLSTGPERPFGGAGGRRPFRRPQALGVRGGLAVDRGHCRHRFLSRHRCCA
jgi:NADH-quinone oxidoreductase subunit M